MFKKALKKFILFLLCCFFAFTFSGCFVNDNEKGFKVKDTNKPFATSSGSEYKVVIPDSDFKYVGTARNFNKLGAKEFVYFMQQALGYTFEVISVKSVTEAMPPCA